MKSLISSTIILIIKDYLITGINSLLIYRYTSISNSFLIYPDNKRAARCIGQPSYIAMKPYLLKTRLIVTLIFPRVAFSTDRLRVPFLSIVALLRAPNQAGSHSSVPVTENHHCQLAGSTSVSTAVSAGNLSLQFVGVNVAVALQ